jgi:hypothetical protein
MRIGNFLTGQMLAAPFAACALAMLLTACTPGNGASRESQTGTADSATAQADLFKCKRGMNRLVLMGGIEDGFSLAGSEPARIRPARLPNAYLAAISEAKSGVILLRDYDETGADKVLIDHFAIPRGITTGALIMRLKPEGRSDNDVVKLGNLDENAPENGFNRVHAFYYNSEMGPLDGVLMVPFEKLKISPAAALSGSFTDYLNRPDRPDEIDLEIDDDTIVDTVILVLCQEPQVKRGTTFAEFRTKIVAPNVSFLSCFNDRTQAPCNPFQGDQLCTAALPLACYHAGNNLPAGLEKAGLGKDLGNGGEVRMSRPVAGQSLPKLADATALCRGEFGDGWRVLDYHDGVSGMIVTNGSVPPRTRSWVNVRDQPYANCWDRTAAK